MKLNKNVIHTTNNYSFFSLSVRNRPVITKSAYLKLRESIKKYGMMSPIIVDIYEGKVTVVDGQHRLRALVDLGMSVDFIYRPGSINAISDLNSRVKPWTPPNYLKYHSNKKAYKTFANFKDRTNLSINSAHSLIKGHEAGLEFKEGKFVLSEAERKVAEKKWTFIEELISLNDAKNKKALTKSRAIATLGDMVMNKKYKHEHFKHKLSVMPGVISAGKKTDAIEVLTNIYNAGLPKAKRITLK